VAMDVTVRPWKESARCSSDAGATAEAAMDATVRACVSRRTRTDARDMICRDRVRCRSLRREMPIRDRLGTKIRESSENDLWSTNGTF